MNKLSFKVRMLMVVLTVLAMFALHNSFWLWKWDAHFPLLFGFMPFAYSYYVAYTLLATAAMAFIVKVAWPDPSEDVFKSQDTELKD